MSFRQKLIESNVEKAITTEIRPMPQEDLFTEFSGPNG